MPCILRVRSMMTTAPAAGLWRMARLPDFAQRIVAFDVGLRFGGERQSIRRLHGWWVDRLAVDQSVQHVQNMRLRRHASLQCEFDGSEHELLVMLEDESQNLDHLAVAARRLKHALLKSSEGGGERRAVAKGTQLALNDRQIAPPIENARRTLSLVRAGASRPRRMSESDLRRLAAK